MDKFFSKKVCDRCGKSLNEGFTMSMFNTDTICMNCKMEERNDPRYKQAVEADLNACKHGNYNFEGIGWKK